MSTDIPKSRSMRDILQEDFLIHGRDMGRLAMYIERINAVPVLAVDESSLWVQTKDIHGGTLYELLKVNNEIILDSNDEATFPDYTVLVVESSREFPHSSPSNEALQVIWDMEEKALRTLS